MEPSQILLVDDDAPQRKVLAGYLMEELAERFSFDGILVSQCETCGAG
jgi:CheY-like chemotaxis protein